MRSITACTSVRSCAQVHGKRRAVAQIDREVGVAGGVGEAREGVGGAVLGVCRHAAAVVEVGEPRDGRESADAQARGGEVAAGDFLDGQAERAPRPLRSGR